MSKKFQPTLTYDSGSGCAYLKISNKKISRTVESVIVKNMMEDLDKSGEIVGLEFLFAKSIDLGMLCPTIAKNLKINFIK